MQCTLHIQSVTEICCVLCHLFASWDGLRYLLALSCYILIIPYLVYLSFIFSIMVLIFLLKLKAVYLSVCNAQAYKQD